MFLIIIFYSKNINRGGQVTKKPPLLNVTVAVICVFTVAGI